MRRRGTRLPIRGVRPVVKPFVAPLFAVVLLACGWLLAGPVAAVAVPVARAVDASSSARSPQRVDQHVEAGALGRAPGAERSVGRTRVGPDTPLSAAAAVAIALAVLVALLLVLASMSRVPGNVRFTSGAPRGPPLLQLV